MLEDLTPAPKISAPPTFKPGIEFDGTEGTATTPGYTDQPNFNEFLKDAGFDVDEVEIVGTPRTSRWQRYDGEWLTAYRFNFRMKNAQVDLPALFAQAKKVKLDRPKQTAEKALIICPADLQVGKANGSRGGTPELIERVFASYDLIEKKMKAGKYERIYILDMGDIIESVSNSAMYNQLESNDLSPMQQYDTAAALMLELIKRAVKYAPVTYGSVASNHCQNRFKGQQVGRPGLDDWGLVVLQQLRRITTELGLEVDYLAPHPQDEGFAFKYGVNVIGAVHGHQASRPDGMKKWWADSTFGNQWVQAVDLLITAHFHHLRVEELGQRFDGRGSKFWVQCPTSDAGSDWYRRKAGTDSTTGILTIELDKNRPFTGSVEKH